MRIAPILIAFSLALAGCGGGGSSSSKSGTTTAAAPAAGKTLTVSEAEFSLTPNRIDVAQAGTVSFKVRNIGHVAHALEIEGNGVQEETEAIQPGSSATLTVKLAKAGSYDLYCPIDGHRAKGMVGSVQVGGSSGGGMDTGTTTTTDKKGKGGNGY